MADDTPKHQPDQPEKPNASTPGDPMATPDVESAIEQADALLADAARQVGLDEDAPRKSAGAGGIGTGGSNPSGNVAAVEHELDALEAMLADDSAATASPSEVAGTASESDESFDALDALEAAIDAGDTDASPESAGLETSEAPEGSTEATESDQMLDALEAAINEEEPAASEDVSPDPGPTETESPPEAVESESGTADGDELLSALEAAILSEPSASTDEDSAPRDDASETPESEFDDDPDQAAGLSAEDLAELDEMIALSVDAEVGTPADAEPPASPVADDATDEAAEATADVATEVSAAPTVADVPAADDSADEVGAVTRTLWLPAAGLVGVCDAIDRVAGRLANPFVKQIIGYVAIGTFALAAMLLAWAWLKP